MGWESTLLLTLLSIASAEPRFCPSYSIHEAKRHGCYVCTIAFRPKSIRWNGEEVIVVKEAWIERKRERVGYSWLLVPTYRIADGYNLCVTLSKGWDIAWNLHGSPLQLRVEAEGISHPGGMMGNAIMWWDIERITDHLQVSVSCKEDGLPNREVTITGSPVP
jgi:hypothetical protein